MTWWRWPHRFYATGSFSTLPRSEGVTIDEVIRQLVKTAAKAAAA